MSSTRQIKSEKWSSSTCLVLVHLYYEVFMYPRAVMVGFMLFMYGHKASDFYLKAFRQQNISLERRSLLAQFVVPLVDHARQTGRKERHGCVCLLKTLGCLGVAAVLRRGEALEVPLLMGNLRQREGRDVCLRVQFMLEK